MSEIIGMKPCDGCGKIGMECICAKLAAMSERHPNQDQCEHGESGVHSYLARVQISNSSHYVTETHWCNGPKPAVSPDAALAAECEPGRKFARPWCVTHDSPLLCEAARLREARPSDQEIEVEGQRRFPHWEWATQSERYDDFIDGAKWSREQRG